MRYLSADEHDKVTSAVEAAEAHTSGEIVTVLTARSDGYSDIALAWSAAAAFTAMAVWSLLRMPRRPSMASVAGCCATCSAPGSSRAR